MVVQIICRDLWALHLSLLPSPPPPEPLLHKQAIDGHHPSDGVSRSADSKKSKLSPSADDKKEFGMGEISPGQCNANTDDSEEDSETDELLLLLSESSSSEDDRDDDDSRQPHAKLEGRGQTFVQNGPASNVALLMVACWTLRLPIIYMDLIRFDDCME